VTDQTRDSVQRLFALIDDIPFAMLTTRDAEGLLRSRPMTTQNAAEDHGDSLWFFASRDGEPVAELQRDPTVNVSYADRRTDAYVSVSGEGEIVDDPARVRRLWTKAAEAWFPKGPDDPDLALIRVRIHLADYWDVAESKPTQIFRMAKAVLGGRRVEDLGERGQVRMD
jgi:general stress protein 26